MHSFHILHHGLRAAVNLSRLKCQRFAELMRHTSCTNNDAICAFLLTRYLTKENRILFKILRQDECYSVSE